MSERQTAPDLVERASASSRASSPDPHQPRPAPAVPQYQTFGPDPSAFDDPTTYHIRDIDEMTSEEEKRQILGVADYPRHDLHEFTCGTPPDRDLQNAKPQNTVSWQQFTAWVDPYFRAFTEEDVQWLLERVRCVMINRLYRIMLMPH